MTGMSGAAVRLALSTLRLNPLRTSLSTLGIIMGAASLAAVLALADGAERFARERIEREGLQAIRISPKTFDEIDGQRIPRRTWPAIGMREGESLATHLGRSASVQLSVSGPGLLASHDRAKPRAAHVTALAAWPASAHGFELASGRFFLDDELARGAPVAIISEKLARTLVEAGVPGGRVGERLELQGVSREVVGMLAPRASERWLSVIVPFADAAAAISPANTPLAPALVVNAGSAETIDTVKSAVEAWVREQPGWADGVTVTAYGPERLRQVRQGILVLKMLMGAFTAISLVVGGIGIMNVLLASVLERTREIGIRKAIGARRRDILVQFLAESVAIATAGSALGVALGLAGAFIVTAVIRARTEALIFAAVTWQTVFVSAAAAVIVGLVFGTYPALRASRLAPIDAIQRE